jgi:DNA-binding protein HU-beta
MEQIKKKSLTRVSIVKEIAKKTGVEQIVALAMVEAFMQSVIESMEKGNNVYLRGFGSFVVKTKARKPGRNITAGTQVIIPAHCKPAFKPAKSFCIRVKNNVEPQIKPKRIQRSKG